MITEMSILEYLSGVLNSLINTLACNFLFKWAATVVMFLSRDGVDTVVASGSQLTKISAFQEQ